MDNVLNEIYEDWFFRDNIADSLPMAKYLAPKIKEYLNISSVFDVGCATGHWLSVYEEQGLDVSGLDSKINSIKKNYKINQKMKKQGKDPLQERLGKEKEA